MINLEDRNKFKRRYLLISFNRYLKIIILLINDIFFLFLLLFIYNIINIILNFIK
jgi:hypothetical protein